jgi:hypothetical protein
MLADTGKSPIRLAGDEADDFVQPVVGLNHV